MARPRSLDSKAMRVATTPGDTLVVMQTINPDLTTKAGRAQARKMAARILDFVEHYEGAYGKAAA